MSDEGDIMEEMMTNMSEIKKEQEKSDEEYSRRKELDLLHKQLDLSMRLTTFYGF